MSSNPKFIRLLKTLETRFQKKRQLFEQTFVPSTFFFFGGFMCGNLFGTFLNFFRNYIHWDGAIIGVLVLFVEWVNYLNFVILNQKNSINKKPILDEKKPVIFSFFLRLFLIIPRCIDRVVDYCNPQILDKKKLTIRITQSFQTFLLYLQRQRNTAIRFINFYKLGLLLGFFIDAFKVGS